eukprot:2602375-Pyramimonas_sp.AAC.1
MPVPGLILHKHKRPGYNRDMKEYTRQPCTRHVVSTTTYDTHARIYGPFNKCMLRTTAKLPHLM